MNKILVIDDDQTMLTMLKFKLVKEKFEVQTALNGELGKQLLQDFEPDLIVTDLMMSLVSRL
ncbi:MAG: two-component system alkaline phosphatase synthesis response regulator PhoP [Glaciecola sp.]|jgi:two-component system alkaline phosphatase synthesis response regulator PhoP